MLAQRQVSEEIVTTALRVRVRKMELGSSLSGLLLNILQEVAEFLPERVGLSVLAVLRKRTHDPSIRFSIGGYSSRPRNMFLTVSTIFSD